MQVFNNVTELIGKTPIVKLNSLPDAESAEVLVKLEMFNPGSSVKDRIALSMVKAAEKEGKLKPGGTIVEPTSGNTGIGLAMVGRALGYKVVLTMPDSMSMERRTLLKAFGAELILTAGADGMGGAIAKAEELDASNKDYFMPQQFNNPANPEVHRQTTAREIISAVDGKLDYFVAGVGTGGTLTGAGEVLKEMIRNIKIVAVEPENSAVISGENPGSHKIQGIGAGFIPEVLKTDLIDEIEKISNEEAIETAKDMAKKEGLLVGISSGAAVAAALKIAKKIGPDKTILAIAPDSGERYLSTEIFA